MKRSNLAGALHRPKGMTTNSKRPSGDAKAVFSMDSGAIRIWWYPDFRSRDEKQRFLPNASSIVSMLGSG